MSKPSRYNLQEFCRVCLTYIPKRRRVLSNSSGDSKHDGYDLRLLPQLRELFVLVTSINDPKENNEDVYPQSLCQSCYDKMMDLQDFQNLAINTAEAIYKILNGENSTNEVEKKTQQRRSELNFEKPITASFDWDDDSGLLLAKLEPLVEISIEADPHDNNEFGEPNSTIIPPSDRSDKFSKPLYEEGIAYISISNDSEEHNNNSKIIPLSDRSDKFSKPLYEEGNAYISISNDSEDHNTVDGNGDANTSNLKRENETDNAAHKKLRYKRKCNMLKCPFCNHEALKQIFLNAHIRGVHIGHETPYLCGECQVSFRRYDQLRRHRRKSKHSIEPTFICGINGCDASFKLMEILEDHREDKHTLSDLVDNEKMLEYDQWKLDDGDGERICQLCLKKCSTKYELFIHQRRHAEIKNHVCKVCGIAKTTRKELLTHMRTHPSGRIKCSHCPQEFAQKRCIYQHMLTAHNGLSPHTCSYCSKCFATRYKKEEHERKHTGERPHICNICNKGFTQTSSLKTHMLIHDTSRKHVCPICSMCFKLKAYLISHEKRHQGDKPHICNICARGFISVVDLDTHKQSHSEEEIRAENECGRLDASQEHVSEEHSTVDGNDDVNTSNLQKENETDNAAHKKRRYKRKCNMLNEEICAKIECSRLDASQEHVSEEHNTVDGNDDVNTSNLQKENETDNAAHKKRRYKRKCNMLNEEIRAKIECSRLDASQEHVSEEHNTVDGNDDVNTSNLQKENETDNAAHKKRRYKRNFNMLRCPFCDHQALKQMYLDAHIRGVHIGHEAPYLCGECQVSFTKYEQLRLHRIKSKHSIEPTFICGINGCDASFKLMEALKKHREDKHTLSDLVDFEKMLEYDQWKLDDGDGERICQLCLKKCSTKYELFIHQRRHAEMKNYICKVCGIAKATRRELLTHMRTHPSKKVKCSLCPQEFTEKHSIKLHIQTVHNGVRPYACSYCSKGLATRTKKKLHERKHTGERPYICNICNKGFTQTSSLKLHMCSHDKTLRKHVCSICSLRLRSKGDLVKHKKRHQGHKPHICNICARGFISVVDLDTHKQSHTEEEIRAEIECSRLGASQEHVLDSH